MLKKTLIALSVIAASPSVLADQHDLWDNVDAVVLAESDNIKRGVSQADREGSVGAKVSVKLHEALHASVKVQTANFDGVGHDGVNSVAELKLAGGFMVNDVTIKGGVLHHMFMGDESSNLMLDAGDLNYTAIGASANWKEYQFGVAYTNDVYGLSNYLESGVNASLAGTGLTAGDLGLNDFEVSEVVYSFGYHKDLEHGHLTAELNHVQLGENDVTEDDSYNYLHLGYKTKVAKNTKLSVDYHYVDGGEEVEELMGTGRVFADNQITASLSYKF